MNIITEQRNKTLDFTLKNKALNFNINAKGVLLFKNKNYLQVLEKLVLDDEDMCLESNKFSNFNFTSLKKLNTTFKNVYNNTGTTSVYYIINFIEWKNLYSRYLAPLVLVPLTMTKKNIYEKDKLIQKYFVSYSGEEITSNIVIEEKMKSLGLELPKFNGDYIKYFEEVEDLLKDNEEIKLVKKNCLGNIIYNSGTLYKDYNEELWNEKFNENEIIRKLSSSPISINEITFDDLSTCDLVLPADRSQVTAIQAAKSGKSFVLYGPPGTGKSQTIINIMSNLISMNKKILFVSEKESAIEVIKNRMDKIGLGNFCLDIHDPKKTTKKIMEQIRARENIHGFDSNFLQNKDLKNKKIKELNYTLSQNYNLLNTLDCIKEYDLLKNDLIQGVNNVSLNSFIKNNISKNNIIKNSKVMETIDSMFSDSIQYTKDFIECNIQYDKSVEGMDVTEIPYENKINYILIQHELMKKQRFHPLQMFLFKSFGYLIKSTPVWMMSPISVSKLLQKRINMFDVLIMDEASQIYFENILGSVARTKQVIVVGDNMQMSPNNILSNKTCQSALDVFEKYLPSISLNVHYRSDSQSLINFSNENYYNKKLNLNK